MTASTKKPRAARRRKQKTMTTQSYEVKKEEKQSDTLPRTFDEAEALYKEAGKVLGNPKVSPTSTKQLPVVVTEERTKLGLFEIALLPFLYLEKFIQVMYDAITTRINSRR